MKTRYSDKHMQLLREQWMTAWPFALEAWSKFTRLHMPTLCLTGKHAQEEGLVSSFAMIRLEDQAVVVSLPYVAESGLAEYAREVLAHEIGHHVLAPASLTEHTRLIARMRRALPTIEQHAPLAANLYTDLLINDRLQRSAGLRIADVYRQIRSGRQAGAVWALYMRIYELLWSMERGSLGGGPVDDRMEGDAVLATRLLRSYAREWLEGAGRFASLLLPYLLKDVGEREILEQWFDTRDAAIGGEPSGLTEEEQGEREGAIHPSLDPDLSGEGDEGDKDESAASAAEPSEGSAPPSRGQAREPFEYGEILRAAGVSLTDHEIAVRYYRERARPYLIPFPSVSFPESVDPLPEGLEPWDIGHPIDDADWFQSVLQSPRIIPGMTTVQRVWGTTEGRLPRRVPVNLDLYVDSSGSMANPQVRVSYPALAGAIICLSALRAGASVQATLWSGKKQVMSTSGFIRNELEILGVLTGYYGGATAFPIHVLRDTYRADRKLSRPVHILVISDDGISTMFETDEKGNSGWDVAGSSLKCAAGGGTFVLNLIEGWERAAGAAHSLIRKARDEQGWSVYRIAAWEHLVVFARKFSRMNYGGVEADAELSTLKKE